VESIPERRPEERPEMAEETDMENVAAPGEIRVWRCKVCGYLCARESPPEVCPICRVSRDRFEPFEFP
jgi:rubrerythrin